jgi:hypothetical protein
VIGCIADDRERAKALAIILETITPCDYYELWRSLRGRILEFKRPVFLELIPFLVNLILRLGGKPALSKTVQSIADVSNWWP